MVLLIIGVVLLLKWAMKRIQLPTPQVARWATSILTVFTLLIVPWLLIHRPASKAAAFISQPISHGSPVRDAHGDLFQYYTPDVWPLVALIAIVAGCLAIVVDGTAFAFWYLIRGHLKTPEVQHSWHPSPALNVQFISACLLARALLTAIAHPSAGSTWLPLSLCRLSSWLTPPIFLMRSPCRHRELPICSFCSRCGVSD